jgi:hypothetical protein
MPSSQQWDTERAARLARKAFRYVARTYPPDAPLEPLGRADAAAVEAELDRIIEKRAQERPRKLTARPSCGPRACGATTLWKLGPRR